jgi:hypothetical protein
MPPPNSAGDPFTWTNNYSKTLVSTAPMNNISIRTDLELTSHHRFFGRASREQTDTQNEYFIDVGGKGIDKRIQASIGVGETFTISSATILDVSAGFTRYTRAPAQPNADMLKYGFPASFVSQLEEQKIPLFSNTDMTGFGAGEGTRYDNTYTWSFQTNMRHIRGRHSMKWGFRARSSRASPSPAAAPPALTLLTAVSRRALTPPPKAAPSETASPPTCWACLPAATSACG